MLESKPEHRRRASDLNGNGNPLAGLPWYVRALAIVGVPSSIAIFLVWMGAKEVPSMHATVLANNVALVAVAKRLDEGETRDEKILLLLRHICSNTARTGDERAKCFEK